MRHMKTVEIPARTEELVDKTTCDFCGETIVPTRFEKADVKIEFDEGYSYPEGGRVDKTVFDCCPRCWGEKVLPALRGLGATPRNEAWDF